MLNRLGCRISEAVGVRIGDIDFERKTVRIEHLKTRLSASCPKCGARLGRRHLFCPGCGDRVESVVKKAREHRRLRELPLDGETMKELRDYVHSGGPVEKNGRILLFGFGRHPGWQIVRGCAERAGLPDLVNPETGRMRGVSPHRLRDAFATIAMKCDPSVEGTRMLQEQLGHASFNTTAKYRKVAEDEHRKWYQRVWDGAQKPDI